MTLPKELTTVTPVSKTLAVLLFIILPICAFFLGENYQQMIDMNSSQHSLFVPNRQILTPTPSTSPLGVTTITLKDNNKTVTVHVGDRVILQLGNVWIWDISMTSNDVLVGRPTGIYWTQASIPQGQYEAVKKGTVTLSAIGTANCKGLQACPQLAIQFHTQIIVL